MNLKLIDPQLAKALQSLNLRLTHSDKCSQQWTPYNPVPDQTLVGAMRERGFTLQQMNKGDDHTDPSYWFVAQQRLAVSLPVFPTFALNVGWLYQRLVTRPLPSVKHQKPVTTFLTECGFTSTNRPGMPRYAIWQKPTELRNQLDKVLAEACHPKRGWKKHSESLEQAPTIQKDHLLKVAGDVVTFRYVLDFGDAGAVLGAQIALNGQWASNPEPISMPSPFGSVIAMPAGGFGLMDMMRGILGRGEGVTDGDIDLALDNLPGSRKPSKLN